MRVGFTLGGTMRSTGGSNYLLNLVRVLREHSADRITPVVLAGADEPAARVAPFEAVTGLEVVRCPALDQARQAGMIGRSLVFGRDAAVNAVFSDQRLDAVFEAATFYGWRPGLAAMAWFPDFQHRALPHLFTRAGWWRRELGFRVQVLARRHVVVSSEDARRTAIAHYVPAHRVSVVRFAVPPPTPHDEARVAEVVARYRLPRRYVFMPNQFWRHKNHLLVVEALARVATKGAVPTVLASGALADPRNPGHVEAVRAAVRNAGLEGHFLMPGLLPRDDMTPLLLGSAALLNPSLFEGWSTSVEEARSAGVPMLLSDLEVHREQAGQQARYFDRHDPESLAGLLRALPEPDPAPQASRRQAAYRDACTRVEAFARAFAQAAERATACH